MQSSARQLWWWRRHLIKWGVLDELLNIYHERIVLQIILSISCRKELVMLLDVLSDEKHECDELFNVLKEAAKTGVSNNCDILMG